MPGKKYSAESEYRYGFNGKENLSEIYGESNAYDFGARIQDPRLGRWLSVDPLGSKFPNESPFSYAGNSPVTMIDPDGQVRYNVHMQYDAKTGKYTVLKITKSPGLMPKYVHKPNSMYVDHVDWYNYQTFQITVVNADPKVTYDIKIPDQGIGVIRTTTNHELTNNETWAKLKTGDGSVGDGGIVFTSYDPGVSRSDLERNPEFMANIYGVMAAVGGIAGGGPVKPEVLPWEEYLPDVAKRITDIAKDVIDKLEEQTNSKPDPVVINKTVKGKWQHSTPDGGVTDGGTTSTKVKPAHDISKPDTIIKTYHTPTPNPSKKKNNK